MLTVGYAGMRWIGVRLIDVLIMHKKQLMIIAACIELF